MIQTKHCVTKTQDDGEGCNDRIARNWNVLPRKAMGMTKGSLGNERQKESRP